MTLIQDTGLPTIFTGLPAGIKPLQRIKLILSQLKRNMIEKILRIDTVSEIAYKSGFKYPQHFTRAFKKITGYTPLDYRRLN